MVVAVKTLPRTYEYQVIQDGIVVASAWGRDHDAVLSQASHYAAVYAQDGPVELRVKPDKRKRKRKATAMTDAIEAGARAIAAADNRPTPNSNDYGGAKACIEAAIASGALVPASEVAEMKERCRKAVRKAVLELSPGGRAVGDICDHAITVALRQLDLAPACGDYVVVPRTPSRGLLISMALRMDHAFCAPVQEIWTMKIGHTDAYREVVLADLAKAYEEIVGQGFYQPKREEKYTEMLNAASSNGGEK